MSLWKRIVRSRATNCSGAWPTSTVAVHAGRDIDDELLDAAPKLRAISRWRWVTTTLMCRLHRARHSGRPHAGRSDRCDRRSGVRADSGGGAAAAGRRALRSQRTVGAVGSCAAARTGGLRRDARHHRLRPDRAGGSPAREGLRYACAISRRQQSDAVRELGAEERSMGVAARERFGDAHTAERRETQMISGGSVADEATAVLARRSAAAVVDRRRYMRRCEKS